MAIIMGVRDEDVLDRACDLGVAFQLTNIARDIVEDAQIGRAQLPREPFGRDQIVHVHGAREALHLGLELGAGGADLGLEESHREVERGRQDQPDLIEGFVCQLRALDH